MSYTASYLTVNCLIYLKLVDVYLFSFPEIYSKFFEEMDHILYFFFSSPHSS